MTETGALATEVSVSEITDPAEWDNLVNAHGGHPLQLWGWGEVKSQGEWTARRLLITGLPVKHSGIDAEDSGAVYSDGLEVAQDDTAAAQVDPAVTQVDTAVAQVLVRQLPFPFRALCYVPRGPAVGSDGQGNAEARSATMRAIVGWCRSNVGGIAVSFEPDWPLFTKLPGLPYRHAANTILYPHTLILDLTKPAEELLKKVKKSTRYEIRRTERDGIEIRVLTDPAEIKRVLDVYHETSHRAGFAIHDDQYYLDVADYMGAASRLVTAIDGDGKPCSFAWTIISDKTGFLLYAGRNEVGSQLKASAAVYWAAIEDARAQGCTRYDLNGLYGEGISTFKKNFASHADEMIGTLDIPTDPILYRVWERALPRAKRYMRAVRERKLPWDKSVQNEIAR